MSTCFVLTSEAYIYSTFMHSPDTFIQSNSCCVQGMNVVTFELFPVVAVWCDPVFGWLCKLLLFCLLGNMWTSYCPSEATRYLHISLIRYFSYFQLLLESLKSDLLHLWISVWCFVAFSPCHKHSCLQGQAETMQPYGYPPWTTNTLLPILQSQMLVLMS